MVPIEGILTALVTPMNQDESVNEQELKNQVNRQINSGIHGIFCLGTNGEFYSLSQEEKIRIMNIVIDEAGGRVPIVVGAGCITTHDTIEIAKQAKKANANAISVIVPYFIALSQQQLYEHYMKIADTVSIPMFIYNIPMRTVNNIEIETVKRLMEHPNIIGIKDSSGDINNVKQLINETDNSFNVFVGTDSLILETLKAGGRGAIAGCGNLFPKILAGIYNSFKQGNIEQAEAFQQQVNPIRTTFKFGNPNSIVKRVMSLMGFAVGPARFPANIDIKEVDQAIMEVLSTY